VLAQQVVEVVQVAMQSFDAGLAEHPVDDRLRMSPEGLRGSESVAARRGQRDQALARVVAADDVHQACIHQRRQVAGQGGAIHAEFSGQVAQHAWLAFAAAQDGVLVEAQAGPGQFMVVHLGDAAARASLGAVRYSKQDDLAQNEEPSDGYTLVDAHLAYRWDRTASSWEVFLDGSNLTDEEARPHTSLLRDYAPLPGRGVAFGIRAYF